MPTAFRRPPPRGQAALSRSRSLDDVRNLSAWTNYSLRSISTESVYMPSRLGSLASNEVLVYYDASWSTDDARFPQAQQRTVKPEVQPRPGPDLQAAAARMGAEVALVSVQGSPARALALVKAVHKAKGFAKVVAKRSIRKLRNKKNADMVLESSSAQSLHESIPGGWTDTDTAASGISIVVTSETDADESAKVTPAPALSECRFSLKSSDGAHIPVPPAIPQNSEISVESEWPSSPELAEETAFELLNILYGYTRGEEEAAEQPTVDPGKAKEPSTKPDGLLSNIFHVLLFFPWCIAVGGAILLMPADAGHLAFRRGFNGRKTPVVGRRRFAYWAANAYEHVFVFLAFCALFYAHHPTVLRLWILGGCAMRFVWVWQRYTPPPLPGLVKRLGEDDQESLWLVWQGKVLINVLLKDREQKEPGPRRKPKMGDDDPLKVHRQVHCPPPPPQKGQKDVPLARNSESCINRCACHNRCPRECPQVNGDLKASLY
ncbi:hypothetical protein BV20DRAFT_1054409 [Pilatotrama ljubarskyi]|nr:hypothetical protein BV20DRAFT_1054409 [Pilatotrama ljubarskyi]